MASLADSVQRSAEWSDRHSVASIVLLAASIGSLLVVLWLGRTRALLHPVRVTAACVVAVVAAAVTVLPRARVEWDQLALWAVTGGEGIDGFWVAGFDEGGPRAEGRRVGKEWVSRVRTRGARYLQKKKTKQ